MVDSVKGTALVLEGGGMRGVYTAGVLDSFLDQGLFFDYVIGVSAGASHALSYISRQKGRARRVNVDYCRRSDYMGLRCLLRERSFFGMRLIFEEIPHRLDPFDYGSFTRNVGHCQAVVTNLQTGDADYLPMLSPDSILSVVRASCSLPYVSPPVYIDGVPYLDGGVSDSIPVRRAFADGCARAVVVLTQPRGYRKRDPGEKARSRVSVSARLFYRGYPEFAESLSARNARYNESLDLVDRLEAEGSALVIRPAPQAGLNRLERDPERLNGLHRSGYADADSLAARIREFCA